MTWHIVKKKRTSLYFIYRYLYHFKLVQFPLGPGPTRVLPVDGFQLATDGAASYGASSYDKPTSTQCSSSRGRPGPTTAENSQRVLAQWEAQRRALPVSGTGPPEKDMIGCSGATIGRNGRIHAMRHKYIPHRCTKAAAPVLCYNRICRRGRHQLNILCELGSRHMAESFKLDEPSTKLKLGFQGPRPLAHQPPGPEESSQREA